MVSSAPVVLPSSAARRPTRRPLRHPTDPLLSVAGQTALVVPSPVALSFSVTTETALVTRSPAHSRAFFSFALAAVHVLEVVVTLVGVPVPVVSAPPTAPRVVPVVEATVETRSAAYSTAAAAERATTRRAPMHYSSLLSTALAAVAVCWSVVGAHASAGRGAVGVIGAAVVEATVETRGGAYSTAAAAEGATTR